MCFDSVSLIPECVSVVNKPLLYEWEVIRSFWDLRLMGEAICLLGIRARRMPPPSSLDPLSRLSNVVVVSLLPLLPATTTDDDDDDEH